MQKLKKVLSSFWFIHFMFFLGFFALFGYIGITFILDNKYGNFLLLGVYMSFSGAICGSFIKVIDIIKEKK